MTATPLSALSVEELRHAIRAKMLCWDGEYAVLYLTDLARRATEGEADTKRLDDCEELGIDLTCSMQSGADAFSAWTYNPPSEKPKHFPAPTVREAIDAARALPRPEPEPRTP